MSAEIKTVRLEQQKKSAGWWLVFKVEGGAGVRTVCTRPLCPEMWQQWSPLARNHFWETEVTGSPWRALWNHQRPSKSTQLLSSDPWSLRKLPVGVCFLLELASLMTCISHYFAGHASHYDLINGHSSCGFFFWFCFNIFRVWLVWINYLRSSEQDEATDLISFLNV